MSGRNGIGIRGMTISEVEGFGQTGGRKEVYRGWAYIIDFTPKIKIEIVAPDDLVSEILDAIERTAKMGKIDDEEIFASDMSEVLRIRTGERGKDAL